MLSYTSQTLRKIRATKGMTRTEFAELLGIPFHSLRTWEQGTRKMSIENIVKVCDALAIPYDVLLLPRLEDIKQTPAKTA